LVTSCSSLPFVQRPAREIPSPFSAQLPWLERCECDYGAPLNVAINAKYREARGQYLRFQAMLTEYLDAMNIDAARTILDIGCSTGVAARAIARRKGFTGRVTGIDLSAGLVQVAERLSTTEGVSEQIQFVVGDTRRLNIPDEAFDAVVAHTLVSHIDDPLLVVNEAARIVRRGETVGIFDGDYSSITFDHPNPAKGTSYDEALISAIASSPPSHAANAPVTE